MHVTRDPPVFVRLHFQRTADHIGAIVHDAQSDSRLTGGLLRKSVSVVLNRQNSMPIFPGQAESQCFWISRAGFHCSPPLARCGTGAWRRSHLRSAQAPRTRSGNESETGPRVPPRVASSADISPWASDTTGRSPRAKVPSFCGSRRSQAARSSPRRADSGTDFSESLRSRTLLMNAMPVRCCPNPSCKSWPILRCSRSLILRIVFSSRLRSLMSRIALETSTPSSVSSGLRLISTGNSLPSLCKPYSSSPAPIGRTRGSSKKFLRWPGCLPRRRSGTSLSISSPSSSSRR